MKISELKQIIKEEIQNVLKEAVILSVDGKSVTISSTLVNKLKAAMEKNAYDEVKDILTKIYKKAGRKDAEELAARNMKDKVTETGNLDAVVSLIKDPLS